MLSIGDGRLPGWGHTSARQFTCYILVRAQLFNYFDNDSDDESCTLPADEYIWIYCLQFQRSHVASVFSLDSKLSPSIQHNSQVYSCFRAARRSFQRGRGFFGRVDSSTISVDPVCFLSLAASHCVCALICFISGNLVYSENSELYHTGQLL